MSQHNGPPPDEQSAEEAEQPSKEWIKAFTPPICRGTGKRSDKCDCLYHAPPAESPKK